MSAYILYCNDRRAQVQSDHPELRFGELARELAQQWQAASPEPRRLYEQRAAREKRVYKAAMVRYRRELAVLRVNQKQRMSWTKNFDVRSGKRQRRDSGSESSESHESYSDE